LVLGEIDNFDFQHQFLKAGLVALGSSVTANPQLWISRL
jgi:hypothetical protein